jgi:hypothetical protein
MNASETWTAVCLLVTPLHGSLLITAAAHPTKAKSGKKRQKSRFIYIPQHRSSSGSLLYHFFKPFLLSLIFNFGAVVK